MILIKNIEFYETNQDPIEIVSHMMPYEAIEALSDKGDVVVPISEIRELIKGQRFRRSDGVDIIVGLTKQAQDILGLQYEAWDNMQKELEITHNSLQVANETIKAVTQANIWTRIKYLFCGYKVKELSHETME